MSSFSDAGDSSLTVTASLATVGVEGRGGGDWMVPSLLRVCRSDAVVVVLTAAGSG